MSSELGDLARQAMEAAHVPGVAVGVLADGEESLHAFGLTSIENPLEVTPDTLFQVGSISKTVAATACVRLVEEGRLDLDAPVVTYLPDLRLRDPETARGVTARHLLTHSGGLFGDDFVDTGDGDDALQRAVAEMADLEQLTPLGAIRSYCNSGFYLVGRLIEVLTGRSYEAAIRQLVFGPLAMERSCFSPADVMTHRFVVGHRWRWDTGRLEVGRPWPLARSSRCAGGVVTSARELLRYGRHHLADDPALAAMREPQPPDTGMVYAIGLAWHLRDVDGVRLVQHGGATLGQTALLTLVPERRFAVAVLTNGDRGPEVFRPLTGLALARHLGLHDDDPTPIEGPPDTLRELAGGYRGQLADYGLAVDGDALAVKTTSKGGFPTRGAPPGPAPPQMHVRFFAQDRLVHVDGPARGSLVDVLRDAKGRVEWLRLYGRVCRRT